MTSLPAIVFVVLNLVAAQNQAIEVDARDVDRRADLVGREIAVDGRVALFQLHQGKGFDEIAMRESDVAYRLAPQLRFQNAPRERVVRVQGVLKKEGDLLVVDVTSLQLLPSDEARLERALRTLAPDELTTRSAWSRWATHRAEIYNDDDLRTRAQALRREVFQIRAERADARSPEAALALANEARAENVAEPFSSALAHRAFRQRLAAARDDVALAKLASDVEAFFPAAAQPLVSTPPSFKELGARYDNDPEAIYRDVPAELRGPLDRRLLADVIEKRLRQAVAAQGGDALALSEQARAQLPDRPNVATELRAAGLTTRADDVTSLRRAELLELAKQFEVDGEREKAAVAKRTWLDFQREKKLDRNDATGRGDLADDYLTLVNDKATAAMLLQEALALDPGFTRANETLRRIGYRKDGDNWVPVGTPLFSAETEAQVGAGGDDPLLNLTPNEVVARLGGKPDRRSIVITQGTVMMQWVYDGANGKSQYINFKRTTDPVPRVVSRYTAN